MALILCPRIFVSESTRIYPLPPDTPYLALLISNLMGFGILE
jgi:hypothetical protein